MTVLCKDCRWFGRSAETCDHPDQPLTDLVHGRRPFCIDARRAPASGVLSAAVAPDYRGCGPAGKLFEAREGAGDGGR